MKKHAAIVVAVLVVGLLVGVGIYLAVRNPHTSDAEKFALSAAKGKATDSALALNASPKYKACMETPACVTFLQSVEFNNWVVAQGNINGRVLAVFAADKIDVTKWQLDPEKYDYVAIVPVKQAPSNGVAGPEPAAVPASQQAPVAAAPKK